MRINCHAHIFNLQSVLTTRTVGTFINRLAEIKMPDFLLKILTEQLKALIDRVDDYTDEEVWMRGLIKKIKESGQFGAIKGALTDNDFLDLKIHGADLLEDLAIGKLEGFFNWLGEQLQDWDDDAHDVTIWDVVDFVRTGLQPSVRQVTQSLMEQLEPDSGVVALMMDITKDGSEEELFERQTANTSKMVLAYPGRIFPFFAVNPIREDHLGLMTTALEKRGFVGVKLYPSLGYAVDSQQMRKVYDYCVLNHVPITVHSTNKGFRFDGTSGDNADPEHWETILGKDEYHNLKVCFAHFGGDQAFVREEIPGGTWTAKVVDLMKRFPNVYADISYHTAAMGSAKKAERYLANLRKLVVNPKLSQRILFGTDFFLVRARLKEDSYWNYYEALLEDIFQPMATRNPVEFLGLPAEGAETSPSIINYVQFVYEHRDKIESLPTAWLLAEIKRIYGEETEIEVPGLGPEWNWSRDSHYRTWSFMVDGHIPPPDNSEERFAQAGLLAMRSMNYWNREFEYKEIWLQKLDDMAERFDSYLLANDIAPRAGYEDGSRRLALLKKAFDQRDLPLYKLAKTVEPIYRFDEEA